MKNQNFISKNQFENINYTFQAEILKNKTQNIFWRFYKLKKIFLKFKYKNVLWKRVHFFFVV